MILFEKYYGRERYECWTRVFNNIDELITFLQEHKENLLGTPNRNKHFKIVATMYNKGEIGEFLGFNE